MSCFHPLIRSPGQTWHYDLDTGEIKQDFKVRRVFRQELDSVDLKSPVIDSLGNVGYRQLVPCGKCIGCRLDYAREWADRLTLEYLDHDPQKCFFVTLTYDIPPVSKSGALTLCKRDTQLFWKRLRKEVDSHIRYFIAGEYGSKTHRPHYHAIIYDLPLNDLTFWKKTDDGYMIFNSDFLDSIWQHGRCDITNVTYPACCYVARYCLKKVTDYSGFDKLGIEPEFTLMSRKPGLGLNGFDPSIYETDRIYLPNGRVTIPPRYFDKQMEKLDLDKLRECKDRRVLAVELAEQSRLCFDSRSFSRFLSDQEEIYKLRRLKSREPCS